MISGGQDSHLFEEQVIPSWNESNDQVWTANSQKYLIQAIFILMLHTEEVKS